MAEFSYLSVSNSDRPSPAESLEGQVLLNNKYSVPVFWYVMYSPEDIRYPQFPEHENDQFWYRNQPPFLITTKEKAVSRLETRKQGVFRLLHKDQKKIYEQFEELISGTEYGFLHLYADRLAPGYEMGALRKKMLDLLHTFEELEAAPGMVDLLFSPLAYELAVNPKYFFTLQLAPKYFLRKFQHKYWEWKGVASHERDTYPLRDEDSFIPPSQFDLVGLGEAIQAPWQ